MDRDPYAAPKSIVRDPELPSTSALATALGFLCGTGAAFVVQVILGQIASWIAVAQGVRVEALYDTLASSTLYHVIAHGLNVLAAGSGGVVAAALVRDRPYMHAGIAGALMVALVVLQFLGPYVHPAPFWSKTLALLLPIPSTLLGAYWWRSRTV